MHRFLFSCVILLSTLMLKCRHNERWWLMPYAAGFPCGASGKEHACWCRRCKRLRFHPWVGKIPWRRAWQLTSVVLPRESHGQRSPEGCSPRGCKESDMTELTEHPYSQFSIVSSVHSLTLWSEAKLFKLNCTKLFLLCSLGLIFLKR